MMPRGLPGTQSHGGVTKVVPAQKLHRRPTVQKYFQQQGVKQFLLKPRCPGAQGRPPSPHQPFKRQAWACVAKAADARTLSRGWVGAMPSRAPVHTQH